MRSVQRPNPPTKRPRLIAPPEIGRSQRGGLYRISHQSQWARRAVVRGQQKIVARVRGVEWHVEFMSESMAEVLDAVPFLTSLGLPYVFDHVAHAAPFHNAADRAFCNLLAVLSNEEHAWINLYSF